MRAPTGLDGISIVPALLGKEQRAHDYLYWEFFERGFQQAVRQGDWKLVRQAPNFKLELFNLRDDVGETRDLAATRADVAARLRKLFESARAESKDFPTKPV